MRRPVAGLGRFSSTNRLVLALPGAAGADAKLDVPATAVVDGLSVTVPVEAPAFNKVRASGLPPSAACTLA